MREISKRYIKAIRGRNSMPPEDTTSKSAMVLKDVFQPLDETDMLNDITYMPDAEISRDPRWDWHEKKVPEDAKFAPPSISLPEYGRELEAVGGPSRIIGPKTPMEQQYIDAIKRRNDQQLKLIWNNEAGGA